MAINREELINLLVKVRPDLPDDMALKFMDMYPKWEAGLVVTKGQRYQHEGVLYTVLSDHTTLGTWTPNEAHSLFAKVLIPDDTQIYPWQQPESTNGYKNGDQVTHKDKVWESLVNDNVWEPGAPGTESLWREVL